MKKTKRKIYVPPQMHVICLESKQTLLAGSTYPTSTVDVNDWDEDTSTNLGSERIDAGSLW